MIKKVFFYIEPLWLGKNNKVSIRSTLAIIFSIHFMVTLSHAVNSWDAGRSLSDLGVILGIEAAMIGALLALRTYQNMQFENKGGGGFNTIKEEEIKGSNPDCGTE